MPNLFRNFKTFEEIDSYIKNLEQKLDEITELCINYGQIDGAHHKMWVIDQILRISACGEYNNIITKYTCSQIQEDELDEMFNYWDEGIAP